MSATVSKICLLGDWQSGRSRLLRTLTDVAEHPGVTTVAFADPISGLHCRLWDYAGRSLLDCLGQAFLADADGLIAVVDERRAQAIAEGELLLRSAFELIGARPALIVLSHADLAAPAGLRSDLAPVVSAGSESIAPFLHGLADLLQRIAGVN